MARGTNGDVQGVKKYAIVGCRIWRAVFKSQIYCLSACAEGGSLLAEIIGELD
jgi:hypothetical protein